MSLGVALPIFGPLSLAPGVVALARLAEQAGADSVWAPDHLCVPRAKASRYPYAVDGAFPFPDATPWFDCLTVLAAIAGAVDRIRLGTGILVLPQRNPLEVAKVASSIDQISGGRLQLGVGAGWFEEEIAALGYSPRRRGQRLDEGIQVMRQCWTGETRGFDGDEVSVDEGVVFLPTPAQPSIPVLVGGMSKRATRRAALLGDGWFPDAPIEMFDGDALASLKAEVATLRADAGRASLPFEHLLVVDTLPERVDELPAIARQVRDLGFDEMVFDVPFEDPSSVEQTVAAIRSALSV